MEQARDVVVGGGVWGCSLLYHLAALGMTDCLLIEQDELADQTTGQAAGMIGPLRASSVASRGATYGVKVGLTPARVAELRRRSTGTTTR